MNAELMLNERHIITEKSFVEIVVWRLPAPATGSGHAFKYRHALVVDGRCVLRYDNEQARAITSMSMVKSIPAFSRIHRLCSWSDPDSTLPGHLAVRGCH